MARLRAIHWLLWASLAFLLSQALTIYSAISNQEKKLILQPSLVDEVNTHSNAKWKADLNPRFANTTVEDFKRLLGSFMDDEQENINIRTYARNLKLPTSFDAREAWPQCVSLQSILDQGHCGSCWAFGAVEALSDRFCIHYNESVVLSENDLLSCCGFDCGSGCNGGYSLRAWQYFIRSGVVTSECVPYFDTEGCQHPGCDPLYPTPQCVQECKDNTDYQTSKYYASSAYRVGSDPYHIMAEVYTNGPVEVSFQVFEDFAHYKSGVYHYVSGEYLGGHAVKLIGWGTTDEGVDYWLLANSWNQQWGQDGYFLIQRGVNECGIEGNVVAGMPASPSLLAVQ
eukprot:c20094_g1_i2 orf=196-1218(+)